MLHHVASFYVTILEEDAKGGVKRRAVSMPQKLKKIKMFDLSSVVKPLDPTEQERQSVSAFKRLLASESTCEISFYVK